MTCTVCEETDRVGWLTQSGSHCRDCHRSWTSKKQAHCPTCCAHFSTPNLFDAHLLARGCQDPATVTRKDGTPRFRQDEAGMWKDSERWDPEGSPFTSGLTRDGGTGGLQSLSPEAASGTEKDDAA